jgi:GH35 family endo-1,4-beta-xylanase
MMGKMTDGRIYRISGWMKLDGASSSNINVTVAKTDDSGTAYTWVDWATGYDNQWTELKGYYTLDVNGTLTNIVIYFEGPAAGVNYYLDDVEVVEVNDWNEEQTNARIEQVRKRDAQITVTNQRGQPLEGVEVNINQVKHQFAFGSAINYRVLSNPDYAQFFKDHYEWAVCENESKWYSNEPTQGNVTYTTADNIYNWCASNGIIMRGHGIYWEVEGTVQQWIKDLAYAPLPATSPLRSAVESRMNSAVNHFKGKFVHWDVDNEMLHGSFYKDRLGPDIHPWMFQAAKAIDPDCKLFVNDYSVVAGPETEEYKAQIQDLLNRGAPVEGIGAQCHFNTIETYAIYDRLDSLSDMNLPIWCTEYDYSAVDENDRADGLEKFYRTAFSHPAVEGILMWGFWEDSHWRDYCHIVNSDWTLNEAGRRYESLMSEWTTNDANTTDSEGNVNFRGFHGTYEVEISVPGIVSQVETIELSPGQTPAEYTLVLDCMLASDLNRDCFVDLRDIDVFAEQWLNSGDCSAEPDCADLVNDDFINFLDFAEIGIEWNI